jgi:hypothetical protein
VKSIGIDGKRELYDVLNGANILANYTQAYDAKSKIMGVTSRDGSSDFTYDDAVRSHRQQNQIHPKNNRIEISATDRCCPRSASCLARLAHSDPTFLAKIHKFASDSLQDASRRLEPNLEIVRVNSDRSEISSQCFIFCRSCSAIPCRMRRAASASCFSRLARSAIAYFWQ